MVTCRDSPYSINWLRPCPGLGPWCPLPGQDAGGVRAAMFLIHSSCSLVGSPMKLLENFGLDKDPPLLMLNLAVFPVFWKHFNKWLGASVCSFSLGSCGAHCPCVLALDSTSWWGHWVPQRIWSHCWGIACHGEDPLGLTRLLESQEVACPHHRGSCTRSQPGPVSGGPPPIGELHTSGRKNSRP